MKDRKKKKVQWQQWIVMGFSMLIGGVCGVLMVQLIDKASSMDMPLHEKLLSLFGLLIGMYGCMFLQLIIHEAGHLVFGLQSGYRFSSFRIGSFMWLKENDGIVYRKLSLAGTAGQCLMAPPDMKDGKIPVILYNLGGSMMNLIASAVFFAVYLLVDRGSLMSILCLMAALLGVCTALVNGIPMRMGTVDNDGYNALSLGKCEAAMRAFWLQLKINEQISKGIRLKEMPEEWFAVPADGAMKNSMVAAQAVFAANRLLDQHRFEEADQLMTHLLEIDSGMIGLHRNLMICDRMYCELIQENRKEMLEAMATREQTRFMKSMKKLPTVIRTEYAWSLLAEQDDAKAAASLKLFDRIAKTYPYPSDVQSERELILRANEVAGNQNQKSCRGIF